MFEKFEIPKEAAEDVRFSTPAKIELFPLVARLKEAEEQAPAMEVQAAQLREEFLNIPELSRENWESLSPEQRLAALNTLEQRAAEIGCRDPLPVVTVEMEADGVCRRDRIEINAEFLEGNSNAHYTSAINAVIHEGRHAYQYYNMYVSQVEKSDELVEAWRLNMDLGYDDGTRKFPWSQSILEQNTQAREVDADAFTEAVLEELEIKHYNL